MNEPVPLHEIVDADLFKTDVRQWAARIGVEVSEIHVRPMTKKWASASTRGRLTFDTALLTESREKRDEVIVHELLHLKVGNHGPLFRRLLAAYLAEASNGKIDIYSEFEQSQADT